MAKTTVKVDPVYTDLFIDVQSTTFAEYLEKLIQVRLDSGYKFNQFIPAPCASTSSKCYGFIVFTQEAATKPEEDAYHVVPVTTPRRD